MRPPSSDAGGAAPTGGAGTGTSAPHPVCPPPGGPRHLLDVDDLTAGEVRWVLRRARGAPRRVLAGRGVALVFEKPSARTRNSTEMAVVQVGGHPVTITAAEVGIDRRESAEDVARTLACYHSVIGARVADHGVLERMAAVSPVPVVNLLSDRSHPLQAFADLLTVADHLGDPAGMRLAWVGDANNVWRSLALAATLCGMSVRTASPPGYGPTAADLSRLERIGADHRVVADPYDAVEGAAVVVTDVWTSMGQEDEADRRRRDFAGYTVTTRLMDAAATGAVFLHCLPAHRGEEVEAAVIDGPRSLVWHQAANRMHAARAVLELLVAGTGTDGGTDPQELR